MRLNEVVYGLGGASLGLPGEVVPVAMRCSFDVYDINSVPPFVALSYTWGKDDPINDFMSIDGREWPIRKNLSEALQSIWDEHRRKRDDEGRILGEHIRQRQQVGRMD